MRAALSRLRGRRSQTSRGGPSRFFKVLQQGWSRGDSNPGPPPCKGGALPAKLRPPICTRSPTTPVGAPGLEPGTSALSGPRSHHLSYAPVIRGRPRRSPALAATDACCAPGSVSPIPVSKTKQVPYRLRPPRMRQPGAGIRPVRRPSSDLRALLPDPAQGMSPGPDPEARSPGGRPHRPGA